MHLSASLSFVDILSCGTCVHSPPPISLPRVECPPTALSRLSRHTLCPVLCTFIRNAVAHHYSDRRPPFPSTLPHYRILSRVAALTINPCFPFVLVAGAQLQIAVVVSSAANPPPTHCQRTSYTPSPNGGSTACCKPSEEEVNTNCNRRRRITARPAVQGQ